MCKPLLAFLALFFYVTIILTLHVVPTGEITIGATPVGPSLKLTHLLHLAMFLPWGIITGYLVYAGPGARMRRALIWIGLGLLLATAAETVQILLPYRSFAFKDLLLNQLGVLVGSFLFLVGPWLLALAGKRGNSPAGPSGAGFLQTHSNYNSDE